MKLSCAFPTDDEDRHTSSNDPSPHNNLPTNISIDSSSSSSSSSSIIVGATPEEVSFSSPKRCSSPGGTLSTASTSTISATTLLASPSTVISGSSSSVTSTSTPPSSPVPAYKSILKNIKTGKNNQSHTLVLDDPKTNPIINTPKDSEDKVDVVDNHIVTSEENTNNQKVDNRKKMSSQNNTNGTRVWVKKSAVEAVRNPRLSFKEKMTRKASMTSGSIHGSMNSNYSRQTSFTSGAGSVTSFSSQRDPFGDNDSEIGSIGIPFLQTNNRSDEDWGWTPACMVDSSNGKITIQLEEDMNNPAMDMSSSSLMHSPVRDAMSAGNNDSSTVVLPSSALKDGDIVMANEYQISSNGSLVCPDDLISLSHLHEPAVVECLQRRYDDDKIYTATGPVLLALNPFQNIRGLYGESTMKRYWDKAEKGAKEILPPHVYAIADEAFRSMMRSLEQSLGVDDGSSCDQSILVSGESGAGKTVTTKFVMKYLAALSQRAGSLPEEKRAYEKVAEKKKRTSTAMPKVSISQKPSVPSWVKSSKPSELDSSDRSRRSLVGSDCTDGFSNVTNLSGAGALNSIEAQVLQSNPILESFGNARTMRNDNSSRFGKFIEIQFTRSGRLVGAQIETYLLEKVRLVTQSPGERNYHIFYEMLSGSMSPEELQNYFIASTARADDFKICASGTYDRRDGVSDKETYRALRAAMKTMNFAPEEQMDVFATSAAILHASNLNFCEMEHHCTLDGENVHLEPVCHLLGVSPDDLNQALCHLSITAGKESQVQQNLTLDQAEKGLEALLKATYGALFSYLVSRINDSISFNEDDICDEDGNPITEMERNRPCAAIGVLDIFGFESFKRNSFEQLCINYCNEKLQAKFTEDIFRSVQLEYEAEGIPLDEIKYDDNQDVLNLIEGKTGLLAMLNEECVRPKGTDEAFVTKALAGNKSSPCLFINKTNRRGFGIHHYAGKVMYDAEGFVDANQDTLPTDLMEAASLCPNDILKNHMTNDSCTNFKSKNAEAAAATTRKAPKRAKSNLVSPTVWAKYKTQLASLMAMLKQTNSRYIRCIKPNKPKKPILMQHLTTIEQLRCAGVVAAVTLSRSAFPNRLENEVVRFKFWQLWDREKFPSKGTADMPKAEKLKHDCEALLTCVLSPLEEVDEKTGKKKKIFCVGKTRSYFKMGALEYLESHRSSGLEAHAVMFQRIARSYLARKKLLGSQKAKKTGVVTIQKWMRAMLAKKKAKVECEKMRKEQAKLIAKRKKEAEERAWKEQLEQEIKDRESSAEKEFKKYEDRITELKGLIKESEDRYNERLAEAQERLNDAKNDAEEQKMRLETEVKLAAAEPAKLAAAQKTKLEESAKLIGFLQKENKKLKSANDKAKKEMKKVKETNDRLVKANESTGQSFEMLNSQSKKLQGNTKNINDQIEGFKKKNAKLREDLKARQQFYNAEAQIRLQYQKTLAQILDVFQDNCKDADLVEDVVCVALECESEAKALLAAAEASAPGM